ncbi:MAG: hypothetical protein ACTSRZ_21125 [Promethearchaeota archaeon]
MKKKLVTISSFIFFVLILNLTISSANEYSFSSPIVFDTGDVGYFRTIKIGENWGVAFKNNYGSGFFSMFSSDGDIIFDKILFTDCQDIRVYCFDMYFDDINNYIYILYTCRGSWFNGYISTIDLSSGNVIGSPLRLGMSPSRNAQEFNIVERLDGIQGFGILASRHYSPLLYLIGTGSGYPTIDYFKPLEDINTYALYLRGESNGTNYALIGRTYNPWKYTFRLYNSIGDKIGIPYDFYTPKVINDFDSDGTDFFVIEYERPTYKDHVRIHSFNGINGDYIGEHISIYSPWPSHTKPVPEFHCSLIINSQISKYAVFYWYPKYPNSSYLSFFDENWNFINEISSPPLPDYNTNNHHNILLDEEGRIIVFNRDNTKTKINMYILGTINRSPIAVCKNVQISADENCQATIVATDVDGGSYDPDEGDTFTLSVDNMGPFSLGEHIVNLTVTDEHGESDTCQATVTVVDNTPPIITLSDPICVNVGPGKGRITNKLTVNAEDNCSGEIVPTIDSVELFNQDGDLVGGTGLYEIIGQDIFVYANARGWTIRITSTAADASGNSATEIFDKALIQCKK